MALLVPDVGEAIALKALLNHTAGQNLVCKLYKSNTTPAETDTAGTYTESTFTGYSSATLTGSSWTISGTAPTSAAYAQQTFSSSANQTLENCYGYFMVQASSGTLVYAERFANAPQAIFNNGDQVKVTPTITCD